MTKALLFVRKESCELCDSGLDAAKRAARWLRMHIDVVDITADRQRYGQFAERLPVVLAGSEPILEGEFGVGGAVASMLRARIGV